MRKFYIVIFSLLLVSKVNAQSEYNLELYKRMNGKFIESQCADIFFKAGKAYRGLTAHTKWYKQMQQKFDKAGCNEKVSEKCIKFKTYKDNQSQYMRDERKKLVNWSTVYNSFCK